MEIFFVLAYKPVIWQQQVASVTTSDVIFQRIYHVIYVNYFVGEVNHDFDDQRWNTNWVSI